MLNDLDRFHLVLKVIDRLLFPGARAATLRHYLTRGCPPASQIREPGEDDPAISDWTPGR